VILTTSPLITANWEANGENRWTVPIGGGFGRIFKIGDRSINAQINPYYNVVTPEDTGARRAELSVRPAASVTKFIIHVTLAHQGLQPNHCTQAPTIGNQRHACICNNDAFHASCLLAARV
jgi:hypothetical protein